ncbi:hypothetical protein HID58_049190, partial [Brassica napus]
SRFIPTNAQGSASHTNSLSISTASHTIDFTRSSDSFVLKRAREVAVKAFVSRDQLVGEGEPRHEPSLLEPEDRAEATGEEDPFHASERHDPLGESLRSVDPLHGPLGLLRDARDGFNRAEEMVPLLVVLDVRI